MGRFLVGPNSCSTVADRFRRRQPALQLAELAGLVFGEPPQEGDFALEVRDQRAEITGGVRGTVRAGICRRGPRTCLGGVRRQPHEPPPVAADEAVQRTPAEALAHGVPREAQPRGGVAEGYGGCVRGGVRDHIRRAWYGRRVSAIPIVLSSMAR